MKRTVYHISKAFKTSPDNQVDSLFPFLNSAVVDTHAAKFIKFKRMHNLCNLSNL